MAENTSLGKLDIIRCNQYDKDFSPQRYIVLALERYIIDPKFSYETGLDTRLFSDAYDVTLTDGQCKAKCLLALECNKLIQLGKLLPGCVVEVRSCTFHFDETKLQGTGHIYLQDISVISGSVPQNNNADLLNPSDIPWCKFSTEREREPRPLVSSRGSYCDLWSTIDVYGPAWTQTITPETSIDTINIHRIEDIANNSYSKYDTPRLLVRVIRRHTTRFFGKAFKEMTWPYQLLLQIADDSGSCFAVFWNSLCQKFHQSIHEGSILDIKHYMVKPHYHFKADVKDYSDELSVPHFDIDLNLNADHPSADVKIIDPSLEKAIWKLPSLGLSLVTRKQLGSIPNITQCDFAGLVTYVGRFSRKRHAACFDLQDSGNFMISRSVCLRDPSHPKPLHVRLYSTVQACVVASLFPGQILLCKHMQVVQYFDTAATSRSIRYMCLTTRTSSQISVLSPDDSQYRNEPIICELLSWTKSDVAKKFVKESRIGGFCSWPPLPPTIDEYRRICCDDMSPLIITPSSDWERIITTSSLRETRHMVIQAWICEIEKVVQHESTAGPSNKRSVAETQNKSSPRELATETWITTGQKDPLQDVPETSHGAGPAMVGRKHQVLGGGNITADTVGYRYNESLRDTLIQCTQQTPSVFQPNTGFHSDAATEKPLVHDTVFRPYYKVSLKGLNDDIILHAFILPSGHKDRLSGQHDFGHVLFEEMNSLSFGSHRKSVVQPGSLALPVSDNADDSVNVDELRTEKCNTSEKKSIVKSKRRKTNAQSENNDSIQDPNDKECGRRSIILDECLTRKRYLCHLNLYRLSHDSVEIVILSAYPLE